MWYFGETERQAREALTRIDEEAAEIMEKELALQANQQFNDMQIEVVGRANLNEWGGQEIPQLFIENYSIKNGEFEF